MRRKLSTGQQLLAPFVPPAPPPRSVQLREKCLRVLGLQRGPMLAHDVLASTQWVGMKPGPTRLEIKETLHALAAEGVFDRKTGPGHFWVYSARRPGA
jgi:hypothetical protein